MSQKTKEELDAELAELDAKIEQTEKEREEQATVEPETSPEEPEQPTPDPQTLDLENLSFGYVVGVNKDGSFTFELLGDDRGVVQLLGLTKFAENQIQRIHDVALQQGDALLNQGMALIFQEIQALKRALSNGPDGQG